MLRSPALLSLLLVAPALLWGCDDDETLPPPDDTPSRAMLTGTVVEGEALSVRVASALPDPPLRSDVNIWRLAVVDASGTPVEGCTIEVEPTMPAHGHGTTPEPMVRAVEGEVGLYEARPLNLFMPGEWHVSVRPSCGSVSDEVVIVVDIQS